jgi:hypothetical protein
MYLLSKTSRAALRPIWAPVDWVQGNLSLEESGQGTKLTTSI